MSDNHRTSRNGVLRSAGALVLGALAVAAGWRAWSDAASMRALAGAAVPVRADETSAAELSEALSQQQRIERGRYLVTIGGCNDCHTPWVMTPQGPAPDMTRMLSGHPSDVPVSGAPSLGEGPWVWSGAGTNTAFAGPWGVSFAANLTPHPISGLGIWDEARFMKAIRTGKHWGESRPILPPMPWFNYAQMTDEDLKSVWAYLRSIPPVHNEVPDALPPAGK